MSNVFSNESSNILYSPVLLPNNQKPYRTSFNDENPKLPESAMFDKVINLSIHREGKPDLVIRSDYTLIGREYPYTKVSVEHKNKSFAFSKNTSVKSGWSIQKCTYKPTIQVKFTVLADSQASSIEVLISNFFVFTGEGNMALYDFMGDQEGGYPITGVDIILGYAPQFPKPNSPEEYFNINAETAPFGTSSLKLTEITFCSYDKAPPNSVFRISGKIATAYRLKHVENPVSYIGIAPNSDNDFVSILRKDSSTIFYELIERRFIKDVPKFYAETKSKEDYKKYVAKDGWLTSAGARKFGCKIIIPKESNLNKFNFYKSVQGMEFDINANGRKDELYFSDLTAVAPTLDATLRLIRIKYFPTINYLKLLNGNIIAWLQEDVDGYYEHSKKGVTPKFIKPSIDKVLLSFNEAVVTQLPSNKDAEDVGFSLTSDYVTVPDRLIDDKDVASNDKIVAIPAVYNISITSKTSVIKCPFFSLVNPFSILRFNARYNLADFARYLIREKNNQVFFFVINYSVDFSTTGKENMMTILCRDASLRNEAIKEYEENKDFVKESKDEEE